MWGGARENAGRKKTEEETKVISFRVPARYANEIRALVKAAIDKFLKGKKL